MNRKFVFILAAMTPAQGFGIVVRQLRLQAGLSQKDLCRLVGLTRPQISWIEHGKVSTDINRIYSFGIALNVTPSEMLRRVEILMIDARHYD